MSFIFGGNTGTSYEDIQRRRKVAQSLLAPKPRSAGEGLLAIADALVSRGIEKKADRQEQKLKDQFAERFGGVAGKQPQAIMDLYSNPMASDAQKKILGALLAKGGVPGFSRGGVQRKPGWAIVGEAGPELVQLPKDATVMPTTPMDNFWRNEEQQYNPNYQDPFAIPPDDGGRFDDANSFQVADASGQYPITPSGVGEQNNINTAANAYRSLLMGLDDYGRLVQEGGAPIMPGVQKDAVTVARRNLQMQMKELYNLGVLNGPDLELMDQILLNPVGIQNKILDVTGIADTEERTAANIKQVKELMRQMVEPKLRSMGLEPESVAPPATDPTQMSDEDLLRALGL